MNKLKSRHEREECKECASRKLGGVILAFELCLRSVATRRMECRPTRRDETMPPKFPLSRSMGLKRECFPLGLFIGLIRLGLLLRVWNELKFQIGPSRGGFAYTFVVLIWCESLAYFEK